MKKKVLIFGLGFQGKKYIEYFLSRGFGVCGVSKSGLHNENMRGIDDVNSYLEISKMPKTFFMLYEYIIIAVKPESEQTKVITFLLNLSLTNSIIIEKPVTLDQKLFKKLLMYENITFFVDEIYFSRFFVNNNISDLKITLQNEDNEVIEHALGSFLLHENFPNIIKNIEFHYLNPLIWSDILYFEVVFLNFKLVSNRGEYFLNTKKIGVNMFEKTLGYLRKTILLEKELNFLYKRNFYLLEKFLGNK